MADIEEKLEKIKQSLHEGQTAQLKEFVQSALDEGVEAENILNRGLISGMETLGQQFEKKEVFVPELLLAARAMMGAMELLEPRLPASPLLHITHSSHRTLLEPTYPPRYPASASVRISFLGFCLFPDTVHPLSVFSNLA